jgi:hypothetical protein
MVYGIFCGAQLWAAVVEKPYPCAHLGIGRQQCRSNQHSAISKTYGIGRKIYAQLGRDKNLFCKRIGTSPLIGGNQGDRISGFHIREDIDRLCQIGFKVVDVPEPLRNGPSLVVERLIEEIYFPCSTTGIAPAELRHRWLVYIHQFLCAVYTSPTVGNNEFCGIVSKIIVCVGRITDALIPNYHRQSSMSTESRSWSAGMLRSLKFVASNRQAVSKVKFTNGRPYTGTMESFWFTHRLVSVSCSITV